MKVIDIYNIINEIADFGLQDSHDNSGILVGDNQAEITKIILSLDITNAIIEEAHCVGANLIISHHPVIYNPLYTVRNDNPVFNLIKYGISAICSHSPLDIAENGINGVLYKMLKDEFMLKDEKMVLDIVTQNIKPLGFGWLCDMNAEFAADKMAEILKNILGCSVVRYTRGRTIKKIAVCSGSGGSMLPKVLKSGADAYITGDVKHDQMIAAYNNNISIFDCGHFHTENVIITYLQNELSKKCGNIPIIIAEKNTDVVNYKF